MKSWAKLNCMSDCIYNLLFSRQFNSNLLHLKTLFTIKSLSLSTLLPIILLSLFSMSLTVSVDKYYTKLNICQNQCRDSVATMKQKLSHFNTKEAPPLLIDLFKLITCWIQTNVKYVYYIYPENPQNTVVILFFTLV